jgi:dienelactone hydrolase
LPRQAEQAGVLLVPALTAAPHAGLVFLHWGFGDRTSFTAEASCYAAGGATSLLLDAPGFGARKGPRIPHEDPRVVRTYCEELLADLRAAVDRLCAEPGVDAERIGFVGHSLGATIAGAFLAAEPRVRAAALLTGHPDLSRVWLARAGAEGGRELEAFDGARAIGSSEAALLFQFAERDEFISRETAERYVAAADASRREVAWYASDHALESDPRALRDRARWLDARLQLAAPADAALARVRLPRAQVWKYRVIKPLLALASRLAAPRRARGMP